MKPESESMYARIQALHTHRIVHVCANITRHVQDCDLHLQFCPSVYMPLEAISNNHNVINVN